jgi:hypothetical protein
MPDPVQTDVFGEPIPNVVGRHPPLPAWIAARRLRPDEQVTWVVGPRFNPSWERYVTHPTLLFGAVAVGTVLIATGLLFSELWEFLLLTTVLVATGLGFGSLFVLGLSCGYFTRLVVTNQRLMILQGYALCRSWGIDDLPRSMIRHRMRGDGDRGPAVDLDAMRTMLGGASDSFVAAKTIMDFGKQLGQIKAREEDRG